MPQHKTFHKTTLLPLVSPVRYYGEKRRQDTDEMFSQALQTYKMKIASMPPHIRKLRDTLPDIRISSQLPTVLMMSTHPTN